MKPYYGIDAPGCFQKSGNCLKSLMFDLSLVPPTDNWFSAY